MYIVFFILQFIYIYEILLFLFKHACMEITRTVIKSSDHRWGQVTFASKVNFRLDEKSEVKRSHTGLKILRKDAEKRVSAPRSRSSSSRMTEYLIGPDEYLSLHERDRHGGQCGKWQTILTILESDDKFRWHLQDNIMNRDGIEYITSSF